MTSTVDLETFRQWTFGDVRVTRIMEMAPMAFDPEIFIQATRHDVLNRKDWLYPSFITQDGDIYLHFQAFVIEAAGRTIVVDTCVGNHKKRTPDIMNDLDNPFLERLERAGFPREKVDYVLCTHLHVDHVGWNTMLVDGEWQPTFPNARYVDAYGLTETCAADTMMEAGREIEKIGSVGRAVAHVEVEIRDDGGETLAPGMEGEICLRGAKVTRGYWKDPERTAASFWPRAASRMSWLIFIEQNLGPHMEQKCAVLCASLGMVSS